MYRALFSYFLKECARDACRRDNAEEQKGRYPLDSPFYAYTACSSD